MDNGDLSETAKSIVAQASNWNFEGDCMILQWMEQISNNLETRAKSSTESLQSITKKLAQTQIALENTQNSLNALQYTKYVEMRCQEDDKGPSETEIVKNEVEEKPKQEILKVFLQNNLKMLHKCHDKFNFLEDSDEDDVDSAATKENCVYQPRNPYNERLLPHIFGTQLWKDNWHVGLYEDGTQHYSGDESSDVYSLSSNSSADIESMASHNTENLSQWTSCVSLNNESSNSSKKMERNSNTQSTKPNFPAIKTIVIPQQNIPKPSETVSSIVEKEKNKNIQPPIVTENTTKKIFGSKPINLFDDNDFQTLLSGSSRNESEPTSTAVVIPQTTLFENQINTVDVRQQPTVIDNATMRENKQPSARLNLFDSPTEESNQDFQQINSKQSKSNLFDSVQSNIPINVPNKTMISAKSLFDDDDDDGDEDFLNIFGKSKSIEKSILQSKTSTLIDKDDGKKEENIKKSIASSSKTLFDDNDDGDDDWILGRNIEKAQKERTTIAKESLSKQINLTKEDKNALLRKNLFLDDNNGDDEILFNFSSKPAEQENLKSNSPRQDDDVNHNLFPKTTLVVSPKTDQKVKKTQENVQEEIPTSLRETINDDDDFLNLFGSSKSKPKSEVGLFETKTIETGKQSILEAPNSIPIVAEKISLKVPDESGVKNSQQKMSLDSNENVDKNESTLKEATSKADSEKSSENIVNVEKEVEIEISNVVEDENQTVFEDHPSIKVCSKDENKKDIEIKTPIYDNYSPLFLDEPPDDDFFQTINSNITVVPSHLDTDFYEPTGNNIPKAANEAKIERNTVVHTGYDIGLFSELPPDDDGLGFDDYFNSIPASIPSIEAANKLQEIPTRTTKEKTIEKLESILNNNKPELLEDIPKDNDKDIPPKQTFSKLKMPNININVQALLPGASVGKSKPINPTAKEFDTTQSSTSSVETLKPIYQTPTKSDIGSESSRENLLTSLCKNRVRGPAKRKASTRAGRQEGYLKTLEIEQKLQQDIVDEKPEKNERITTNQNNERSLKHPQPNLMPIIPSQLQSQTESTKKASHHPVTQKDMKNYSSDLFADTANTVDDNDFFTSLVKSPSLKEPSKNDLKIVPKPAITDKPSHHESIKTKSNSSTLSQERIFETSQPPIQKTTLSDLFDDFADTTDNDDFFSNLLKNHISKETSQIDRKNNQKNDIFQTKSNSSLNTATSAELPRPHSLQTKSINQIESIKNTAQLIDTKKDIPTSKNLFDDFSSITEDDDDIFSSNIKIPKQTVQTDLKNKPKMDVATIFESDDDLFQSSVTLKKSSSKTSNVVPVETQIVQDTKKSAALFDSDTNEDDDDSLFRKPNISSHLSMQTSKATTSNKNLFSDSDDDDDLFGTPKSKKTNARVPPPIKRNTLSSQTPKDIKVKTTSAPTTTDNPLADLLNS